MIGLSRRYAPHLVALCALALLAVAAHGWFGVGHDDCARPDDFLRTLDGVAEPRARFMHGAFEAIAWREGRISVDGRASSLAWAIVRSYRPRRLYYQPEMALLEGRPNRRDVEWLEVQGERIPVHRAWFPAERASGASTLAAYLLIHRGRAVENPVREQLASAPLQLLGGISPMTLIFVGGRSERADLAASEALARDWLATVWRSYRSACEE